MKVLSLITRELDYESINGIVQGIYENDANIPTKFCGGGHDHKANPLCYLFSDCICSSSQYSNSAKNPWYCAVPVAHTAEISKNSGKNNLR